MLSLFPAEKRGGVFAIYGMMAGLAVIAGPTVGGFLVTHFGWRSIFTVNLPFGVIVFALAMLVVPDLRPGRRHRLDLPGVGLATAGLLAVIYGLIEGQRYDWGVVTGIVTIPEIIGAGILLLALFLYYQARRQNADPLVPFEVFKDRNFTLMTLVMAAMGFAILGLYLPLTIYMQSVLGLSAIDAGLTLAIQPAAMFFWVFLAVALVDEHPRDRYLSQLLAPPAAAQQLVERPGSGTAGERDGTRAALHFLQDRPRRGANEIVDRIEYAQVHGVRSSFRPSFYESWRKGLIEDLTPFILVWPDEMRPAAPSAGRDHGRFASVAARSTLRCFATSPG